MMRVLSIVPRLAASIAVGVALACGPASTLAAEVESAPAPAGDLSSYLVEAARANPGLRASHEDWMSASAKVAFARGWPDPTVSYTYYLQEVETALGPQKHALALTQPIPWFGKLSLQGDAQEQAALAAASRFRHAQLDLFTQVAKAYYDLAFHDRSIEITRENLEILRYQESVARARYRTESVSYSDLLKVQVELASLEDRVRGLEDRRRVLVARLNRVLGRAADTPLEWPVGLGSQALSDVDEASILRRTVRDNPTLQALQHDADRHQTLARLARRRRWPDFSVGVKTILTEESELTNFPDRGRDAWMLTLGMKLPLWQGKYGAAVRSEVAAERGARSKVDDARHELEARLQEALFGLQDAKRKIDLFANGLVPKAQQSLEATSTAYQAGTATFLDFLDAQRTLLVFEMDLARAQADLGRRRIEITSLMGAVPVGVADSPMEEGIEP